MTANPSRQFGRTTRAINPAAVAGDGCHVIDSTGRRYLDACGGAAVSCLGHSDARVTAAVKAQADALAFAYSGYFTSPAAERLADRLAALAPGDLCYTFYCCGGSEAMESAIKMARQYHIERGEPGRHRIIARWQSYHGNTLGALGVGGYRMRRAPYLPMLADFSHIPACYAWRGQEPGETPEAYGLRMANALEDEILRLGPDTVAAFVAEPVVGAALGVCPPVPGYFRRIREICDRHGVLLILDEVMCGMGRTGTLFACEQEGIAPDIMAIAKGLGAGYQPIGAVMLTAAVFDAFDRGSGIFQHGHTYMAHPVACAAAEAVLSRLVDDGLAAGVAPKGAALMERLRDRLGQHPHVGDIRGRGLFIGLEIVADRETKAPFDAPRDISEAIRDAAFAGEGFDDGLIVYPCVGHVDGRLGNTIILAPPYIVTDAEIDRIVDGLALAVEAGTSG
jgi:adenosylmethionine-8-amino-7-oxononanoate aminotransferase